MVLAFLFVIVFTYVLLASRRSFKTQHEVVEQAGSSEYGSVLKKLALDEENAPENDEQKDEETNDEASDDVIIKNNDEENNVEDAENKLDDFTELENEHEKQPGSDPSDDKNSRD